MKILVTGANGQVGKHLSQALSKSPWHFTSLTRKELDISCKRSVFELVTTLAPDIIINAAAFTSVDEAESQLDLAYAVNATGAGFLSAAAQSINAVIIHISTDYVFCGENNDLSYKEEDPTAPLNAYGNSKCTGEVEVTQANPKHIILRTSWVFSDHGNNFFQTMLRVGIELNSISVVDDQFGGPTYAGDLAQVILKIITLYEKTHQLNWGVYHYCGHPYVSWFEFAKEIFERAPMDYPALNVIPISSADYPSAAKRPCNSRLNCAKINATFGIEPSDWKTAVKNLWGTYR